jgi:two-component system, NtrC family, response regulator
LMEDSELREELYYRLSVVVINVPPLRDRREDIPRLAEHFLARLAERYGQPALRLSDQATEEIVRYDWPGNIRQLENVMEHVAAFATGEIIKPEDLPAEIHESGSRVSAIQLKLPEDGINLEQVEKEILLQALEKNGWNQTRAAHYLKITRKTLIYRIEKFGLAQLGNNESEASSKDGVALTS